MVELQSRQKQVGVGVFHQDFGQEVLEVALAQVKAFPLARTALEHPCERKKVERLIETNRINIQR